MSWPKQKCSLLAWQGESIWQQAQRHEGLEIRGKQPCLTGPKGVWTLSLRAVESQENAFGEVGSTQAGPETHCAAQNGLDSRCQPLCLTRKIIGRAVPWSASCLALFLITFINVLQGTIWRTVKKLGDHRFYGLDRMVALCLE